MNLDCDLQCHEYEGDTVDEVGNAVAREFGNDKPDQDEHSQDENSEDELNEGEKKLLKTASWSKPRKISKMY